MNGKVSSFTDLRAWQAAKRFAVFIHTVTAQLSPEEKFDFTSQIRRSATSIAANIAEGFSRSGQAEKRNFYSIALGSLTETLSHSYIAHDLGYFDDDVLKSIDQQGVDISKMTNGLIKSAQGRIT